MLHKKTQTKKIFKIQSFLYKGWVHININAAITIIIYAYAPNLNC